MKLSFRLKTILGIALIETILLIVLILSALSFLRDSNEKLLIEHATSTSRLFASAIKDAVLATDLATLESSTRQILLTPDIVYVRIKSFERILAEGGDTMLLNQGREADSSLDEVTDGVFDTAQPIIVSGMPYGMLEMGFSTRGIEQLLSEARRWTVSIGMLEVILVAIFSLILGTYLTRQLQQLITASKIITESGPGHVVPVRGSDEIAEVANSFNRMSRSMQESYQALHDSLQSQREMTSATERGQEKINAILESSLDAMITIDSKGKIIDYNHVAEETFGWLFEEISGKQMVDFIIPPEYREAHNRGMAHYLATGEGPALRKRLELKAQHKDGHQFPIEIAISPIETKQGDMFTAFIRDITKQKSDETELRLAAQAFKTSEAMFITDSDATILRVNNAFSRITGYDHDDVIGHNPRLLSSGLHEPGFYDSMWRSLLESGEWTGEIYNKRKNGEIFPEYLNISSVRDDRGEITHFIAHFVDITDQKNYEKNLRNEQARSEAANIAKGRFLAIMSHEIRTPMNGILGMLDLLRHTRLDEQQQQLVSTGLESGEILLNIINDILDYSKMEAGKLQLECEPFELQDMLLHTLELLQPQAEMKGNILRLDMHNHLPRYVSGDSSRLRQVLLNLITNAIKFTNDGNITVTVSGERQEAGKFMFECSVKDTGSGIRDDAQETLFDEFTMADQTHSRTQKGTGLGLAICKQLVQLMGGTIDFTSKFNRGSNFTFRIPLKITEAQAVTAEESPVSGVAPRKDTRVLLAEDNIANQTVMKAILGNADLDVTVVNNGEKAIQQLAKERYDIILMDISMPEMDGIEATRHIRQLPGRARNIPIVALTAHALSGDRERFLEAGMNDYLTKPVKVKKTLECIARWTGKKRDWPEEVEDIGVALEEQSGTQAQFIDKDVINQLIRDTSAETVTNLIRLYIDDGRKRISHLLEAISDRNVEKLQFEAHTLGSSAATHGNLALHDLMRKIEHHCRSDNPDEAFVEAENLRSVADQSFEELEKMAAAGFESQDLPSTTGT